jgi:hypothetical protein
MQVTFFLLHRDADGFFDPGSRVILLGFGQPFGNHRGERTDILLVKAEDIGRLDHRGGKLLGLLYQVPVAALDSP